MSKSRFEELYELGQSRYHSFMDNELGENNAILAAVATMLADSEGKSYWRKPGPVLVPDDNPDNEPTTIRKTEIIHTGRGEVAVGHFGEQLTLGDW
jgi:hypothetical protein